MTTIEIAVLVGAAASAVFRWSSWRHRLDLAQLGTVSRQCLAEHRTD